LELTHEDSYTPSWGTLLMNVDGDDGGLGGVDNDDDCDTAVTLITLLMCYVYIWLKVYI